jgi:lipoyl(octanoyl) transferase
MMALCHIHDLGLMDYQPAWDLQNLLAAEIARGERPPTLLLVEHPHTYTFGRRGEAANLLWDEAQRKAGGVSVYWVDRGGDVTYHGPGQLVGYPLIPLTPISPDRFETDYVGYVRNLEKMLIAALARLGLAGGQLNGKTGVWVQPEVAARCLRCRPENRQKPAKIAAIGVKVDARGITRHGFALNVNPDMSYFEGIVPCGILEYPSTSLADLFFPPPAMEQVKEQVIRAFGETFGYETAIASV